MLSKSSTLSRGLVALLAATAVMTCDLSPTAFAAEPKVVATLKPIHAIVAAVMRDAGHPALLIDGAASPHAFAMKPSDVRRLNQADVVIRVSGLLETFLDATLAALPKQVMVVSLDQVPGITRRRLRGGHGAHDGHGHGSGSKEHGIDPHIWLDPDNAQAIARHLAKVLTDVDPAQAAIYTRNAAAFTAQMDALSSRIATRLRPLQSSAYIVFHDAYQYFERRFGMTGGVAVTVSPEVPPSARRISQLRRRIAKAGVACVFAEPQFPPRTIVTLIEGTGARRAILDPIGASLPSGPEHYAKLIEALAHDMATCLEHKG